MVFRHLLTKKTNNYKQRNPQQNVHFVYCENNNCTLKCLFQNYLKFFFFYEYSRKTNQNDIKIFELFLITEHF